MQDINRFDWHEKMIKCYLAANNKRKKNYKRVFHISRPVNRQSILEYGLLPKAKLTGYIQYPPRIFFSTKACDIYVCDFINHYDNIDIWQALVPKDSLQKDEFSHRDNHYFIEEPVPVINLNLIHKIPFYVYTEEELVDI